MRGMILAAGRGSRMQALTNAVPKPLLKLDGYYLIDYSLYAMAKCGIQDVVINICYHREQIKQALGNGARYGLNIEYSIEETALETGGGVLQALPLLGNEPFIVLSADVVTDYPLNQLPPPHGLAHLVLVPNPIYHEKGDFSLLGNCICLPNSTTTYTFANVGIYRPELFASYAPGYFRLGDVLKQHVPARTIQGEVYQGIWHNLGRPEDLLLANDKSLASLLTS